MTDDNKTYDPMKATPLATLLDYLMDPRVPKSEREHAAAREIERLRNALHGISLGAQNSMTSKEALGKEARAALEQTK